MSASSTQRRLARPQSSARADAARTQSAASPPRRTGWWAGAVVLGALLVAVVFVALQTPERATPAQVGSQRVVPERYDAERAFGYLEEICAIGPRISGTEGMHRQQELLLDFFRRQGAEAELQSFPARHPLSGETLTLANLIARFYPERPKRFLLCAHYDTLPFPDRDPINPRGVFLGANDGASGVAALMELSHHLDELPADVGVDMVLFDGEELVYDNRRDPYFLGSTHYAREYVAHPPAIPLRAGILLDMVADAAQQFYLEKNSWHYARPVAREVWDLAGRLGVRSFKSRVKHEVRDDHLPLNQIARIPTIDIIDFDYPRPGPRAMSYWHTQQDIPENCSGESLAAVVYVVHQWLLTK